MKNDDDTPPPLLADLKFDPAKAVDRLRSVADAAKKRSAQEIEDEHGRLVKSLAERVRASEAAELPTIAAATCAVVLDFELERGHEARHIGVNLGHQYGWMRNVELARPLAAGKYRAVILITKRPAEE